jgi:GT2 family glycosyltransferase/glycosyltransferase involved in cell wall biosynthesis
VIVRSSSNGDFHPAASHTAAVHPEAAVNASPAEQPVLIVSGMHRSGTSLMASLCQSAGLHIGDRMMWPADSNLLGHFEDLDFYDFHQRVLAANGACQNGFLTDSKSLHVHHPLREVAGELIRVRKQLSQPWGWKDPRTVLFLEFWQSLLPAARWLFVVRSPCEVVDSLFRRGDKAFLDNPPFALRVWRHYNELVRDFARRHPDACMIVDVSQVSQDRHAVITRIRDRLGVPLSNPAHVYREDLLTTSPPAYRRAVVQAADPTACELYAELRVLSGLGEPPADEADEVRPLGAADAAFMDWAALLTHDKAAGIASRTLDERIATLTRLLDDKAEETAAKGRQIAALDEQLHVARSLLLERAGELARLALTRDEDTAAAAEREKRIIALEEHLTSLLYELSLRPQELADQTREVAALKLACYESNSHVAERERQISALEERLAKLQAVVAERDGELKTLSGRIAERDAAILGLNHDVATHRNTIDSLQKAASLQESRVVQFSHDLERSAAQITRLEQDIAHRGQHLSHLEHECRQQLALHQQVVNSNSWWVTKPLREARRWVTAPRQRLMHASTAFLKGCRRLYDRLPLTLETRLRHRRFLAHKLPKVLLASGSPAATIPGLLRTAQPPIVARAAGAARPATNGLHPADTHWEGICLPTCDTPVVSIIIPAHNQWAHTHACLQSIVRSEPTLAYEVILADDGSTDATRHAARWVQGLVIHRNRENLGFLRNCNAAAQQARGEYVLFLNNDTEIQPGAISALVQTFRDHPDAGLVGSKLLYADGRLQEAGGIVWADGSAWNYGRGQNPQQPEFNYLRETDYCSGASIMVPRSLFAQLGGFDQRYSPAYNEDSDLAFAVRAAGRNVYYQPASVVVHHEGVSHGTDSSQGVKSGQAGNQRRFRDKWHDTLTRDHFPNGQNVFRARDRSANRKTILIIDHYVPQPDRDAGSRTMWCFLRLFRSMGMNVKFWPQNLHYDQDYTPALEQEGIEVFYGPQFVDHFEAWARENGSQLDYVLLSRPHIAIEFVAALRRHTRATLLFYGHDLHHARLQNEFEVKGDPALHKQSLAMLELEQSLWRQVDAVYYPSTEETSVVARACPGVTARTVTPYFFDDRREPPPGPLGRTGILFVAGFGHPPNVDAAEWLVREIMPLVRREIADAHLWLVGSNPTAAVQQLASEAVTVTGHVSDDRLNEFYRTARVAVVPLRFGAGVKSKVIEAMHHGLPLVTTPTGAQGGAGVDLILPVSADPARLAQEIVALIRDDGRWREVASAGHHYASTRFSMAAMRETFSKDILPPVPASTSCGVPCPESLQRDRS